MTPFFEGNSNLLTASAFGFVLDSELKRAVRSQNYLTLVTLEASRDSDGQTAPADDGTLREVAQLIGRELRDSDLIGHTSRGMLSLVLLDADLEHAHRVINRLVSRLDGHTFAEPLRIALGAASYPTHAVDADSLTREALARPVVKWRSGLRPPADLN
jgi:GGDEF domain-containing protein